MADRPTGYDHRVGLEDPYPDESYGRHQPWSVSGGEMQETLYEKYGIEPAIVSGMPGINFNSVNHLCFTLQARVGGMVDFRNKHEDPRQRRFFQHITRDGANWIRFKGVDLPKPTSITKSARRKVVIKSGVPFMVEGDPLFQKEIEMVIENLQERFGSKLDHQFGEMTVGETIETLRSNDIFPAVGVIRSARDNHYEELKIRAGIQDYGMD